MALITINGAATNVTATGEDVVNVVQNATNLNQLSDVSTNGINDGDLLIYNSSSNDWENGTTLSSNIDLNNNNINGVNTLLVGTIENGGNDITLNENIDMNDNSFFNINTAKIKKISPDQFENANTPRTRFYSDWSHPGHQAALGGNDISGAFLMGAADLSPLGASLPFSAMGLTTPNGHDMFILGAAGGDNDNGSHDAQIWIRGDANSIISTSETSLADRQFLSISAGGMTLNCNDEDFEISNGSDLLMNGLLKLESDNITAHSVIRRVAHDEENCTIMNFTRWNNDGGTDIDDNTKVDVQFRIADEDNADQYNAFLIGGFTAVYDTTNGNRFGLAVNDSSESGANELNVHEKYTSTNQPLQFPEFTTTERDAMSPQNGWVLYNSTTNKLQVRANGSWVDLH